MALLIITLPVLQSLLTGLPVNLSKPLGGEDTQRTIYNPSDGVLRDSSASRGNPNFLFEFLERPDIESLDSTVDGAWSQAMNTPLGGFLLVRHNETYSQGWGVSMFHSIHCLGILRSTMQNYFGLAPENGGHAAHAHGQRDGATLHVDERKHVEHCLGYIGRVRCLSLLHSKSKALEDKRLLRNCYSRLCCAMATTPWSHHLQSMMLRATSF